MALFTASHPIREALANSIIWEEHRGDFARARAVAEEQVAEAQNGDPRQLSIARLALGLIRLLQGEPAAALDELAQADRLCADDAPLRALVFAYKSLALRGCFHIFPDGSGGVTLEVQDRWNLAEALGAEDKHWAELASNLDPAVDPEMLLEASFLFHLLRMLPLYRQLLDGRYVTPPERVARQREMILGDLLSFYRRVEEKGNPSGLLAWIERTIADIHRRLGEEEEAQAWLDRAFERSAQAADPIGMAVCRMMLGDWRAAPLSSPWAWNLLLQEGTADSSLSPVRERAELSGGGADAVAAEKAYAEAERLFQQANARRGLGPWSCAVAICAGSNGISARS
jgi:tetratricopeptide (TPR) repeat protein